MVHGEILCDEGSHAMPKQYGRLAFMSLRQIFMDKQCIREQ